MNEKVGDILVGTVIRLYPRYAILLFESGRTGLLHISELSNSYVRNFTALVQVGNIYKVKVIAIDEENGSMRVSVKQLTEEERHRNLPKKEIDDVRTSFEALKENLPNWIEEQINENKPSPIRLNSDHLVSDIDIASYQERVNEINEMMEKGEGDGSDFLGWKDYPFDYDKEEFAQILKDAKYVRDNYDALVVCGIGGSYLGARSAIDALRGSQYNKKPEIIYLGHTIDPDYLSNTLEHLKNKRFAVNVISKGGTTTETSISFRLLKSMLESKLGKEGAKKAIFATTDSKRGALLQLAKTEGYRTYVLPSDIGGRYSVFSAVGLFPMAVAGIDIKAFMRGASQAAKDLKDPSLENNDAYKYAVIRHDLYSEKNKSVEFLITYSPYFVQIGEWWKQLFGESEGKDGKGLLPASLTFTTDLHSMGQFVQEGSKIFFETSINVKKSHHHFTVPNDKDDLDGLNYLSGRDMNDIRSKVFDGVISAHEEVGKNDNLVIEINEMNPYYLGYLFYFFMKSCAMSAYLNGINPFNQPGVEIYKKNMFHLLNKPGY